MPWGGLLLFLPSAPVTSQLRQSCVNALGRATPISTVFQILNRRQTPSVNALGRATPISTNDMSVYTVNATDCVNALGRATPIST